MWVHTFTDWPNSRFRAVHASRGKDIIGSNGNYDDGDGGGGEDTSDFAATFISTCRHFIKRNIAKKTFSYIAYHLL